MKHYAIKGKPSRINWTFHSIAGEEFSLAGYTYRLYYSSGTSRSLATGVVHSGNVLTWDFTPNAQWKNGIYDIAVEVMSSGTKIVTVTYPQAFTVLQNNLNNVSDEDAQDMNTIGQDDVSTINLVSSCDFNRFVPLAPVVGSDGKWYIDGQVVLDDNDNPVYADSTIDVESDGTIIVNQGRHDQYTITSLKSALELAAADHSTAASDHSTATSDHTTAASDHSTAASDHSTATSDHLTAVADHNTAANDHTAATEANALAASDHTTAASDHSTAYADHGTAVSDHNTATADHLTAAADHSAAGTDRTNAAADRELAASDHERAEEDHTAVTEALGSLGEGFVSAKEAQSFTDSEKAQARANIGAGTYSVPSGGIPSNQMTTDVQSALAKANSAVQPAGIANFITTSDLSSALSAKQDKLISGTNLKTINNTSLLGSGNINIQGGGGSDPDAVKYTQQSLTSEQQAQARTNIGAGTYSKPSGGIPATDLASAVQTSLEKADTALQSFTETDPTVPPWAKESTKPSYSYSEISGTPTLATVATSGSYSDLSNTPDLSGFITKSVNDLTYYYLKTETYSQTEVNSLIGAINQFHYEIAASTSAVTSPASNVLYLIGPTGSGSDKYEEYIYPDATTGWVKIGDTSIDLSGYVTTSALNTALADYTTTTDLTTLLGGKADKVTSATSGNFAGFDSNGNLVDSGHKHSDYLTSHQDISGKEDTSNKVSSWSSTTTDTHYPSEKLVKDSLDAKQAALVSGTNIKTINNTSLLGSGNIDIQGGGISTITLTFTPNEGETYFGTKAQAATALGITTNEVDSLMAGDYDRLIFNGLYADKSTPGQVTSDAAYQRYVAADYNGVPYSLYLIYEDDGYSCWWKRQVPALSTSISSDGTSNTKAATPKAVKDYVDALPLPTSLGLFQFTPTESSSYISLGNAAAAATALSISESQLEMLYEGGYYKVVLRDSVEGKICIGSESLVNSNATGISYEIMSGDVTPHMLEFFYESSTYKYRYYQLQGGGGSDAVLYTAQTLTAAQQTQARENIDAIGGDDVETVTELGIDTVVTEDSDNLITSGAVYTAVQNASQNVVEVNTASSTIAAQMNTIYQWTVDPTDITLSLPSAPIDVAKEIHLKFYVVSSSALTLSLPSIISWRDGVAPNFEAENIYDIVLSYDAKEGWLGDVRKYWKNWVQLPTGYTAYQWIGKPSGSAYIDTNYVPKTKPRIITSYYFTATMDADLFGSAGSPYFIFNPGGASGDSQTIFYKYGNKSSGSFASFNTMAGQWYTVDAKDDITIGGVTTEWATSWDYSNNSASVYIFGGRNNTIVAYRLKRVKLYDGDTLVRDLIPCTDPNNVAGMYDVVNGVFYASANVGQTFEVGN